MDADDDPLWADALASPEREYWIASAQDEIRSLRDLKVFVLVSHSDVPTGQRPLRGKLVCKRKRDDSGKVVRYKVRYVAKGFAQRFGIDYDKTTAPTSRLESELAFLRELLTGLGFAPPAATPLLCDNDAARKLAEDHVGHPNVKHIRVKFHYIRELVEDGTVSLTRVRSSDNTADILTKPLARGDFQRLRDYLGIRPTS
jgi:hypothetical protein